MIVSILTTLGGIGVFLIGMSILTEGLRALAGAGLRNMLVRMTHSPFSGAVTGTVSTAILQSSSATTIATVGFVGAGLISFPQALGIIFGANIGTTVTGWLVVVLGFKLKLGIVVTPFILLGALLHLFAKGRLKHIGWTIAGFSLLFFGITAMQQGMEFFQGLVSPSDFPDDSVGGRLILVLIGAALTLITQSSSAGVAAALAALSIDAISFTQAAAMVIGMNVGTTCTAALATIGGSIATRRTGYAHVIYNIFIGVMAFILLFPLGWFIEAKLLDGFDAQYGLVAFHSSFNILGVIVVIWFTPKFADLITGIVPSQEPRPTEQLDQRLLSDANAATDAAAAAVGKIADLLFNSLIHQLEQGPQTETAAQLETIDQEIEIARRFAERMKSDPEQKIAFQRHNAVMHSLDHIGRLHFRCTQSNRINSVLRDEGLTGFARELRGLLIEITDNGDNEKLAARVEALQERIHRLRDPLRDEIFHRASAGSLGMTEAGELLDGLRWLYRVCYHIWRILDHRQLSAGMQPKPGPK